MLTQSFVRRIFEYKEGVLYWKEQHGTKVPGDKAGYVDNRSGYIRLGINCKRYFAHRVVFLYFHGHLPKMLDHKDRNKQNNRIDNLRECTSYQNNIHRVGNCKSTSKYKGVSWSTARKKWVAQAKVEGHMYFIGRYMDEVEAAEAYDAFVQNWHREFAHPNFSYI